MKFAYLCSELDHLGIIVRVAREHGLEFLFQFQKLVFIGQVVGPVHHDFFGNFINIVLHLIDLGFHLFDHQCVFSHIDFDGLE
ncbi:hypothetical protein DSECCO2_610310 [anaerobic digester metagenome]